MKTALFVMMSLPSHFFAGFNLGRQLQARGYRVVFGGQPQMQTLVEKEGFDFQPLEYVTELQIKSLRMWVGVLLKSLVDHSYRQTGYRQFCREVASLHMVEQTLQPDVVVIDSRLAFYSFLLLSNAKQIIINTKLSTHQSPGIPPLESVRMAKNSAIDRLMAGMEWLLFTKHCQLITLTKRTALLNCDETYFYRLFMARRSPAKTLGNYPLDSLHPALRDIPKLITYPRVLEYDWKEPFPDEWYIEMPFQRDELVYRTEEYQRVMQTVLQQKTLSPDQRLIYCSLGTLSGAQGVRASIYLDKVIRALANEPDIVLILATGHVAVDTRDATNIHLMSRVPQLALLQHCDLMITHGGLNSMTECLQVGVPMLAAPLIPRSDHCGNVARIEANGFGLGGDMLRDSPETIRAKALQILHDPRYRNRVQTARLQTQAEQQRLLDQLLETALIEAE